MKNILEVRGLTKRFGGLTAVSDVSFDVRQGEILGLVGPNGAGKTTTFNCVAGALRPTEGSVTFAGQRIDGLSPHQVCRAGVARTFQIVRPFHGMNVWENVAVGAYAREAHAANAEERARAVLAQIGCDALADQPTDKLGVANLRKLEIARALATRPKLLLLDEMLAGLTATEAAALCDTVLQLRESGISFVIVEHSVPIMRRLCDSAVVLNFGKMLAKGSTNEVFDDPAVQEAYLGSFADA